MSKIIKVSIIVPIYMVEKYLVRCIESIINQTYSNLEIILVDDGSLDDCPQICDEYAKKDKRIKAIHKKNGGLSSARNAGMEVVTGDYILFVDSDDYIDKYTVADLIENALENNSDVVIFGVNRDVSGNISKCSLHFESLYQNNEVVREKILKRYYTMDHAYVYTVCNKMYRTGFILENDFHFDPSDIRCEDCWFNFRVFHMANIVSFVDKYYYYYFENSESITHDIKNISYERWVRNKCRLLEDSFSKTIKIDYNSFYYEFLINVIVYLKGLYKVGNSAFIEKIINDKFFKDALIYTKYLPKHIKLIAFLIKNKKFYLVRVIYNIWNICRR